MRINEQRILGALVHNPGHVAEVDDLAPEHLSEAGAAIFQWILERAETGKRVDPILLRDSDPELGDLLARAQEDSPAIGSEELRGYIEAVKREQASRDVQRIGQMMLNCSDPYAAASQAITQLMDMQAERVDWTADWRAVMTETVESLQARLDQETNGASEAATTGLTDLDYTLGGFHPRDLVVVGGRPSQGKTAFVLNAARASARQGGRPGIISAEMDRAGLGVRALAAASGIDLGRYRNLLGWNEEDWRQVTAAVQREGGLPIQVMDKPSPQLGEVIQQARRWVYRQGVTELYIDYLTLLRADQSYERRDLEVGDMAKGAKDLARHLDIPVILLAQLNRSVDERKDPRPVMSDLRDSGEIEQHADQIMFLYRPGTYFPEEFGEEETEIIVGKNRQGPVGRVNARFIGKICSFQDERRSA